MAVDWLATGTAVGTDTRPATVCRRVDLFPDNSRRQALVELAPARIFSRSWRTGKVSTSVGGVDGMALSNCSDTSAHPAREHSKWERNGVSCIAFVSGVNGRHRDGGSCRPGSRSMGATDRSEE